MKIYVVNRGKNGNFWNIYEVKVTVVSLELTRELN